MDVSEAIYTFYIGGLALDIKPEAIIQLIVILLVNKRFKTKTRR